MAAEQHVESEENSEKGQKRKREPSVLDNFTKLTNGQEPVRIKGGVALLKHLTEDQNQTDDELKYTLARLIRGLGSSKVQAKTGFFAALVGLLNLKSISVKDILEHVSKELHRAGSNNKSENADICSGQILVSGAILRSNLYESCDDGDKVKVLQLLLTAGKERTYLTLAAYKFLIDLFIKIDSKEFERVVFSLVKDELSKPWSEHNLDSLYLLLEIQSNFPESLHSKFLKNNLGTAEVWSEESLRHICSILTTIPRVLALKHPIFALCVKKISESGSVESFFEELDGTLERPSRNKYFVFTKLLSGVLESCTDATVIPKILTNNYVQQTISMYKNAVGKQKDKEFKDTTQKLFETLLSSLKKDGVKSKTKIKVLKRLLFFPGTFIFEKVTKSRLVQNIAGTLSAEGVKRLGAIYRDVVLAREDKVVGEEGTAKWWNVDRVYASHLLVKLINHPAMREENEWKTEQLLFLGKLGLFRDQSESMGHELADSLKETFYSSLELKLSKLDDMRSMLSKIVQEFDEVITESNQRILRDPLDEETLKTWKQTVELVRKLNSKSKKRNSVFHTLFLNLGLQLFHNPKLASESLSELFSCYERTKKSKRNEEEASDAPLWIEVVVDLFLNLLSHNSHLLRRVINCVFPHLCKYMNPTAIHQILAVLDPKNDSNPLSKSNEESDEDVDSDHEEEEDDDDEGKESEESSDEDEEDEDNVNDQLRMALHQVLGAGAESDTESVDLDKLSDDEGDKLNEALGQAFKQYKPNLGRNRKQQKDDEALTHFRIRVLDLIEIYLSSEPSMLLTLEIMLPLLQLLEFCVKDDHQRPLLDRVNACLKKLTSLKKFEECENVTEEVLVDLLKSLLDRGTKNAFVIQEMSAQIADCSIYVVTCSQILKTDVWTSKECEDGVVGVIRKGLEAFFTERDCRIPYVLFKNVVQSNWDGILPLIPFLCGFVFSPSVRPFRRGQAVELLKLFCQNQRFISTHLVEMNEEQNKKVIKEEMKGTEEMIVNFLRDSVDFFREFNSKSNSSEGKVKGKFIGNLFELLHNLKNSIFGKSFEDWELLRAVVGDCRSELTFGRDTKLALNKLCNSLGVSNKKKTKEEKEEERQEVVESNGVEKGAEDVERSKKQKKEKKKQSKGDEDMESNKKQKKEKKKKNLSQDQLKLKKQTKELRLQSFSEGLHSKRKFSFGEDDEGRVEEGKRSKLAE